MPADESGRDAAEPEVCSGLRAMSALTELVGREGTEPEVCSGLRVDSCLGFEG